MNFKKYSPIILKGGCCIYTLLDFTVALATLFKVAQTTIFVYVILAYSF